MLKVGNHKAEVKLFVKKDFFGKDIFVGDRVRITRPEMEFIREKKVLPEMTWTGQVRLLFSRGLVVRADNGYYVKPPYTDRGYNVWKWEKID